jgi:N-acyl-D-aspartate/D-glutamate deacylase
VLDLLIRGGEVVDGTGSPRRRADVGVRDGRIVSVGAVDEGARRTVDATGRVVSPGFVDPHTHYDAQVLWDGGVSPSPLHGVTTVVGGNCGFTIAPVVPESSGYVMRMLARVEGIPVATLEAALDFGWRTFGEWLDVLEGKVAVNVGFLVGHSTVRRLVMGEAAVGSRATELQLADMEAVVHRSIDEGALGFSTSRSMSHRDHHGDPVPSLHASVEEVLTLAGTVRGHEGTVLEIVPTSQLFFDEDVYELLTAMSLAGRRAVNWNLLGSLGGEAKIRNKLAASDHAAARGARVIALTMPEPQALRLSFASGFVYDMLPGWAEVMSLPAPAKRQALQDPATRRRLAEASAGGPWWADWEHTTVAQVFDPANAGWEGWALGDVARARGVDVFDALCEIVVADDLRTGLVPRTVDDNDEHWRLRAGLWRDPRVVIGGSDAGAHLDTIWTFGCTTSLVGRCVRERGLIELEEAVRLVTDVPARMYGLVDRGRVAPGMRADLVVFDPARIGPRPARAVSDLPGGAWRLTAGADGIDAVYVNGAEVVSSGAYTGACPGTVLRSGRDTRTVPLPATRPAG